MRTEVKVGLFVALVVVVTVIVFYVNRTRQTANSPSEVVHFDAPADSTDAATERTTPSTRDTTPRRSPVTAAPNTGTRRPQTPTHRTTTPPRSEGGRTAAQPGPRPTAERPEPAGGQQPQPSDVSEPDKGGDPEDEFTRSVRRMAGLDDEASADDASPAAATPDDDAKPEAQPTTVERTDAGPTATPPGSPAATNRDAAARPTGQPGTTDRRPAPNSATGARLDGALPGVTRLAPGTQRHTVAAGDTLWTIAEYFYGDGSLHPKIAAANPDVDPRRLTIGQVLTIPPKDAPTPTPGSAQPATATSNENAASPRARQHTYVVEHGDSLSSIARDVLGDARRWRELYELNRDRIDDVNNIPVGLDLKLPEGQ